MVSLKDRVMESRRFVPLPILTRLGQRKFEKLWQHEWFRRTGEENMTFVLGETERAAEIPEVARRYAEYDLMRNYRRWHPSKLVHQRVEGIEVLKDRDPARGMIVSFMHHAQYDGMAPSIARLGVPFDGLVAPEAFMSRKEPVPVQLRQHYKVVGSHPNIHLVNAADGSAPLAERLAQGHILFIASDVAGRTPIRFMGRDIVGSFGAALLAAKTNSSVVLVTAHPEPDGRPYLRLHEPLEPSDFTDPADLLNEIFKRHEPAILAWPEAYDSPLGRLAVAPVE